MPAARYIGRVGGLAVALGVGTAIVLGGGVANAAPNASGSSGASHDNQSSGSTSNQGSQGQQGKGLKPKSSKGSAGSSGGSDAKTAPSNGSGAAGTTSGGAGGTTASADPVDAIRDAIKQQLTQALNATAASGNSAGASKPGKSAKSATAVAPATSATSQVSQTTATGAVASTTPATSSTASGQSAPSSSPAVASVAAVVPTTAAATTTTSTATTSVVVQPLAQVVADLLKPFVGSTPNAPVEPTAAWVLLAAVRRELGIDTGTGSTVTSNSVANTSTTTSLTAVTPTVASTAAVNPLVVPTPLITITDGIINGSIGTPFTGTLVYTVVSGPTGGAKINLNTSTGTYTYLPYLSDVTSGTPENFSVLVAQQTAFDTALESIPLVGSFVPQLLVTVYQAPVLGQLLAQIIGSSQVVPVNVDLATLAPAGTPVAYTYKVASFDGTLISTNFFPASGLQAGDVAPTIMDGPGLGNAGDTNPNSTGPVGVGTFRDAGYNVVTWDPRGEYDSGGVLQLDNPAYEGKDVSAVISWIAYQNGVQLDNPGDPRLGMIGGSYGGGIQWVSAAQDPRIDAIVPTIAWNSLNEALYPDGAFKTSWASLLLLDLVQTGARINPQLYSGVVLGDLFGVLTQSQQDLLTSSGPAQTVSNITAPTLLIQGTVDDLFTLQQAMTNANLLTLAGNPNVKMIWYCGGHGVCLDPVDSTQQNTILTNATLDWMNTYLKGETSADTLPTFQWVDQTGQFYTADTLPTSSSFYGTPITDTSTGGGFLPIVPIIGGSGPDGAQVALPYSLVVPTKATNAINVPLVLPTAGTTQVVGAPSVSLTYSGLGTSRFVYGQIIDNATGQVVGNVVTPIPVTLDGQTHQVTVNLEDIAYTYDPTTAPAGDPLTLQLVASTTPYQSFTSFGYINISDVGVTLPTVGAGADAMPVTSAAAAAA